MSHSSQFKVLRMRRFLVWSGAVLGLALTGMVWAETAAPTPAEQPQSLAAVEELKSQAFQAIRSGDFQRSSALLNQAASMTQDPTVQRMAGWTRAYDNQCKTFYGARHEQFEKAVANVHRLMDHKLDTYAIDEAARAYLLADDKDEFAKEPWIVNLINESAAAADTFEAHQQWLESARLYSDLCSLQPSVASWQDKFDLAMRRVTLLMIYAPDKLKKLQDVETAARAAEDKILFPTTRPAPADAAATTEPSKDDDSAQDVDWHEVTKGIQYDMLWDSLVLAEQQYYRDVTFQDLLEGGLNGLSTMLSTPGLESAFPGLGDAQKRSAFQAGIDQCMANAKTATDDNAEEVLTQSMNDLRDLNEKTVQLPEEVFVSEFADGAFSPLDPFSKVIWPSEIEDTERMTQGEFGGVGLEIENDEQGNLKVVTPLEDTPAFRAGIEAGDIITQIDGKSAKGLPVDRAVKEIVGPPGTNVDLQIRTPNGIVKNDLLRREEIKVASVEGYERKPGGGWDYFVDPEQRIAYVRLTSFSKTTSDDLDSAIQEMKAKGAKAIILDLRDNLGGLLPAATAVVNKFVSNGVIVRTQADRVTSNPPIVINARADEMETDLPMIVLVNQWSASASEIVSGALKDDRRALLVGQRTYGKGSVQMLFPLDDSKAYLKLTTAHYYLPSGRCIHREKNSKTWGVDPDVTVEMTPEQMRTVIDTRQEMDVLRDADAKPTQAAGVESTGTRLLKADSQLSAGLLMLRLELAGAQL
jgi:carboxyl-terminal processing protease